jgi:hypothetical protein
VTIPGEPAPVLAFPVPDAVPTPPAPLVALAPDGPDGPETREVPLGLEMGETPPAVDGVPVLDTPPAGQLSGSVAAWKEQ